MYINTGDSKRILLCGCLIVDLLKTIESYPGQGMLGVIRELKTSPGGNVCNNAANLKRLDPELMVGAMGKIGHDQNGQIVLEHLQRLKVETRLIAIDEQAATSFTDVFTVKPTGIRTFFYYGGANTSWGPLDIPWDQIAGNFDLVQLGYILLLDMMDLPDQQYGTKAAAALAEFQRLGIKTSIDLVSEESDRFATVVTPALPYVDYLIINEVEAEKVTGIQTRSKTGRFLPKTTAMAARQLIAAGVSGAVVIHAPEGAVGMMAGGGSIFQPSYQVAKEEIRSTVGAGDAFASGVLYGLLYRWELQQALALGAAMGAMNLLSNSASDGARSLNEVRQFMNERSLRTDL
jgi:sugar/nucleoside kinase (ribokinase family)